MGAIYYGSQEKVLWRLGDTSSRVTNQIGLNEFLLDLIAQGISSDQEIYQKLYENNFKKKPKPSKESDVNLALKTIKNFNFIEREKNKRWKLTSLGKKFYNLLHNSDNEKELNPNLIKLLQLMNVQFKDLVWLSILFNIVVSKEDEKEYAPFIFIMKQLTKNSVNDDFLIKWTYFHSSFLDKQLPFNDKTGNAKDIKWEKGRPENLEILKIAMKNHSLTTETIQKILNSEKDEKLKKILRVFAEPVLKNFKNSKLSGKTIPEKLANDQNFLNQFVDYLQNNFNYQEFCNAFTNNKKIITARDEYMNINLYWIKNIKIFLYLNDELTISKVNQKIFTFIFEQLKVEEFEHLDFDVFINYLTSEDEVKKIFDFLITEKIDFDETIKNQNSQEEKLVSFEITKNFIQNLTKYLSDNVEMQKFKKQIQAADITNACLVEYMVNLFFYYKLKEKHPKILFREFCNTNLWPNGLPNTHASGGQPDGSILVDGNLYVIETTIIDNQSQLIKAEIEPIRRHFNKLIINNQDQIKSSSLLFFAPKYDFNTLQEVLEISTKEQQVNKVFLNPVNYNATSNPFLLNNSLVNKNLVDPIELKIREDKVKVKLGSQEINYNILLSEI